MLIESKNIENNFTYIVGEKITKKWFGGIKKRYILQTEIENLLIFGQERTGKTVFSLGQLINLNHSAIIYEDNDEIYNSYVRDSRDFSKIIKIDLSKNEFISITEDPSFNLILEKSNTEELNNFLKHRIDIIMMELFKEYNINITNLLDENTEKLLILIKASNNSNVAWKSPYNTKNKLAIIGKYIMFNFFSENLLHSKNKKQKTLFLFEESRKISKHINYDEWSKELSRLKRHNGYIILGLKLWNIEHIAKIINSFDSIIKMKMNYESEIKLDELLSDYFKINIIHEPDIENKLMYITKNKCLAYNKYIYYNYY